MKYPYWVVLIVCIFLGSAAHAQDDSLDAYEIITPGNVEGLQLVNILGRGIIFDVAWSPDGTVIVTASETGVWLYDPEDTLRVPRRLLPDPTLVDHVQFNTDGTVLTAFNADTLWQWEMDDLTLHHHVRLDSGAILAVNQTASQYMVHTAIGLWLHILGDDTPPRLLDDHLAIRDAAFAPDDSQIAILTDRGDVILRNSTSLKTIAHIEYDFDPEKTPPFSDYFDNRANFITYSPDSSWVFVHATDEGLLLDARTGAPLVSEWTGTDAAFSPDGQLLFTYSSESSGWHYSLDRIQNIEQPEHIHGNSTTSAHHVVYPMHADFSSDSQYIALGWYDRVYIYDTTQLENDRLWYMSDYNNLRFEPVTHAEGWLYGYEVKAGIRRWHLLTGEEQQFQSCAGTAFDTWRDWLICYDRESIQILDMQGDRIQEIENPLSTPIRSVQAIASGIWIEDSNQNHALWVAETETWQAMLSILGKNVGISPSGRYLVFSKKKRGTDSTIAFIWDIEHNAITATVTFTDDQTNPTANFDPDETRLIVYPTSSSAIVYDLESLEIIGRLSNPEYGFGEVLFSSDGQWLYSQSSDHPYAVGQIGVLKWEETQDTDTVITMTDLDQSLDTLDVAQNGDLLLISLWDYSGEAAEGVYLYRLGDEPEWLTYKPDLLLRDPVVLSPDNQLAVMSKQFRYGIENPGILEINTIPTLEEIVTFQTYTPIKDLWFAFDGRFILANTESGAVYVYGVPPAS